MGARTALRLGRTVLFALVCVAVSGLGHALMSGAAPPLLAQATALVPVCGAGWWLARRERGAATTVAAHVLGQSMLHAYFAAIGPRLSSAVGAGVRHHGATGHAHHPGRAADGSLAAELLAAFDGSAITGGMAAAHLLAGLVCGWWLWRGEVALARLGRCLALFLRAPLRTAWRLWSAAPPAPAPARRRPARRGTGRRARGLLAAHSLSRRGPPLRVRPL
ncbi:hypothetical protein ACIP6P_28555 [Streptomyces sp. NPDC088729]|uniref:hypothetical protein n=1 Tax=Streptomyces sp. NPDC088729 TaxID=3365876 RepID=UPI0037FD7701